MVGGRSADGWGEGVMLVPVMRESALIMGGGALVVTVKMVVGGATILIGGFGGCWEGLWHIWGGIALVPWRMLLVGRKGV